MLWASCFVQVVNLSVKLSSCPCSVVAYSGLPRDLVSNVLMFLSSRVVNLHIFEVGNLLAPDL